MSEKCYWQNLLSLFFVAKQGNKTDSRNLNLEIVSNLKNRTDLHFMFKMFYLTTSINTVLEIRSSCITTENQQEGMTIISVRWREFLNKWISDLTHSCYTGRLDSDVEVFPPHKIDSFKRCYRMQSVLLGAIPFTRHVSTIPFYISKQNEERSLLGEPMNQNSH